MLELLTRPWAWYIAGPLIGLTVPTLLLIGNKSFGISSSFRHLCAACFPSNISFFKYEWKKEVWNLFFVAGIFIGGILSVLLSNPEPMIIHPDLVYDLSKFGIYDVNHLLPNDLFSWEQLFTLRGAIMMIGGGFLVGFGTRYAGGCTSGHAIMGLSNLQLPSLIATICFMVGGVSMTHFILPFLLSL